ncbi:hypothetical protein KW783_00505 [Candidatus Parcubacteria bacterium]|nr:hypothetical protein [Candidatus Parcubacteria bacterium]
MSGLAGHDGFAEVRAQLEDVQLRLFVETAARHAITEVKLSSDARERLMARRDDLKQQFAKIIKELSS